MPVQQLATEEQKSKHGNAVRYRDYVFLGLTQSLCPECRAVVPAKIIARGKRVYLRKNCATHGLREDFICSDVDRYDQLQTSTPAKLPKRVYAAASQGCPLDCGLCSEHEQHTCIGVVEITDSCNLTCPMCYAASAPGKRHRSFDEIRRAIDRLVEAEGHAEVVQLSGGEPTLHPDLIRAIEYAIAQSIDYVMINTNGIRLANDLELVEKLANYRSRLEIYFQMDDLDDQTLTTLRGQSGLLEIKLRALENLDRAGLNVTLVSTLQGGVNDHAPSKLVQFAKDRPFITGLSFQPATYSGRCLLPDELERRITFPDVIDEICAAHSSTFAADDFFPLPCAHPNCHWMSLVARQGNQLWPLSRFVDVQANLDLLANGISFTREKSSQIAKQLASRLACGDHGCCGSANVFENAQQNSRSLPIADLDTQTCQSPSPVEALIQRIIERSAGARDLLRITITSFLDVYNFDVRRVMKCCTHHVLPSGHIIPFCAYNVLYRDGTVPLAKLVEQ